MEYKKISINVPVDAEIFDDTFTPEENYALIKMGREWIIHRRRFESKCVPGNLVEELSANECIEFCNGVKTRGLKSEIREKNRQKYNDRLQELEKQIETMNRELQKYGVIFMPASGK